LAAQPIAMNKHCIDPVKTKAAKVFWFFFLKKTRKQRLLFEKRSKNFCLLGA
jgi:hypothetical protein